MQQALLLAVVGGSSHNKFANVTMHHCWLPHVCVQVPFANQSMRLSSIAALSCCKCDPACLTAAECHCLLCACVQVTSANRLMRLFSIAMAALSFTAGDLRRFVEMIGSSRGVNLFPQPQAAAAVPGGPAVAASPAAAVPSAAAAAAVLDQQQPQVHMWLYLLRILFTLPLFFGNHANFVLPFAYVLPSQIWSLGPTCVWHG